MYVRNQRLTPLKGYTGSNLVDMGRGAMHAYLVRPGSVIAVAADVITLPFARRLCEVPGLTVVTNSIPVSTTLAKHSRPDQNIVLTGGERAASGALVGPLAESGARSSTVSQAFVGPSGLDQQRGLTAGSVDEAAVNAVLLSMADTKIVLADHTRWNVRGVATFGELARADMIVSDNELPPEAQRVLEYEVGSVILAG